MQEDKFFPNEKGYCVIIPFKSRENAEFFAKRQCKAVDYSIIQGTVGR